MVGENFIQDMELLYTVHLPNELEWQQMLECTYHELLPFSSLKQKYESNFSDVVLAFEQRMDIL